jgi:hypothetical protein
VASGIAFAIAASAAAPADRPAVRRIVDPADSDVVVAIEQRPVSGGDLPEVRQFVDGREQYCHEGHVPREGCIESSATAGTPGTRPRSLSVALGVVAELAFRALRAVPGELVDVDLVELPASLVGWQPAGTALDPSGYPGDITVRSCGHVRRPLAGQQENWSGQPKSHPPPTLIGVRGIVGGRWG